MDTNLVVLLTALFASKQNSTDHTQTVVLVLAALAPTLMALAAFIQSRANKTVNVATAETVEKVHVAVNSGSEAMRSEIKALTQKVLELSQEKSTSVERERQAITVPVGIPQLLTDSQISQIVQTIEAQKNK